MEGGGGKILGTYDHNILGPIYDVGAQEDICTARLIPQISSEHLYGVFPWDQGNKWYALQTHRGGLKLPFAGLVNFLPDVVYYFCLNLPAAFT